MAYEDYKKREKKEKKKEKKELMIITYAWMASKDVTILTLVVTNVMWVSRL
jgi:hypothetical protein